MGFNKVIVLGNLTRSPQLKYAPSGTAICEFGLAVNRKYKQGEELKEEVCFLDVTVFGRQAESAAQYLDKGRQALVEGRLQQQRWETEDGQKRSKIVVIAESVVFVGGKPEPSDPHGGPEEPAS